MKTRTGLLHACLCLLALASLQVSAAPSVGHVYLWGQVHQQGAVAISDMGLTVMQAIIMDGGLSDTADPAHIKILRKKSDGSSQVILVNWYQIVGGGPPDHPTKADFSKDVPVLAGDIIVVPQRVVNR